MHRGARIACLQGAGVLYPQPFPGLPAGHSQWRRPPERPMPSPAPRKPTLVAPHPAFQSRGLRAADPTGTAIYQAASTSNMHLRSSLHWCRLGLQPHSPSQAPPPPPLLKHPHPRGSSLTCCKAAHRREEVEVGVAPHVDHVLPGVGPAHPAGSSSAPMAYSLPPAGSVVQSGMVLFGHPATLRMPARPDTVLRSPGPAMHVQRLLRCRLAGAPKVVPPHKHKQALQCLTGKYWAPCLPAGPLWLGD